MQLSVIASKRDGGKVRRNWRRCASWTAAIASTTAGVSCARKCDRKAVRQMRKYWACDLRTKSVILGEVSITLIDPKFNVNIGDILPFSRLVVVA